MSRDFSFNQKSRVQALTVREAGKLGGLTVLRKHGSAHFREIGKKGQKVMREHYPNMARKWGKLGGRPRKTSTKGTMGEEGKKNSEEDADPPQLSPSSPSKLLGNAYNR